MRPCHRSVATFVLALIAALSAGCGTLLGEDGPAFLYRLEVRNDTGAQRLIVPTSGGQPDADTVAYTINSGQDLWASGDPLAGSVTKARILVYDQSCHQVGEVELQASVSANEQIPAYLLVINDPTSVGATAVAPRAPGAAVATSSSFVVLCPATSFSREIARR